jgi:hypothetical protein
MQYKLEEPTLDSRRGKYNVVSLDQNPIMFEPRLLNIGISRHRDVVEEVEYALHDTLATHKYWENEPIEFVRQYQDFYKKLFSLDWIHENEDRHNIAVNAHCCLTLVQYHNHRLIAYSRSTDMKNGYFSDQLLLRYLAMCISDTRDDCKVDMIEWHLAIPHVYEKKGIARLTERAEK